MKYKFFLIIASFLSLFSCDQKKGQADTTPPTAATSRNASLQNQHLELKPDLHSVSKHLDSNGEHFAVTDVEGDLDALCGFVDEFINALPKEELKIPTGLSIRNTLKGSGLGHITAKGESSRKVGDHWHNRIFYATGGQRKGILSLLGGKGSRYTTPDFAPANADLVIETQINLKELKALTEQIAKTFGGEAEEEFSEAMKQKFLGTVMSAGDLLGQFDVRLSMAITVDGKKTWQSEEGGPHLPTTDLVMLLDGATWLWDEYGKQIEKNSRVQTKGPVKYITSKEPIKSPMGVLNPIIVVDSANKQIWFALQESSLQACQSKSPKLWQNPQFKAVMKGLPEEGNAMFFVSQNFCRTLTEIPLKSSDQIEDLGQFNTFYGKLTQLITKSKSGYAWTLSNQADGILIASNSPYADKGYTNSPALALCGAGIPTLFIGANIYKKGADRAACILNIRNIHQAVRAHQNLHNLKIGDPLPVKDIFGPDNYIELRPTCPLGHQYTLSKTIPKVGKAAATCEHEDHHPDDTSGW